MQAPLRKAHAVPLSKAHAGLLSKALNKHVQRMPMQAPLSKAHAFPKKKHIMAIHLKEKPHECEFCQTKFSEMPVPMTL